MKIIAATDEFGLIYYVPLQQVMLIDRSQDDFYAFKYQIVFYKFTYDISKSDFESIISAYHDTDTHHSSNIIFIQLGEKL
jgi:hypothetical protein